MVPVEFLNNNTKLYVSLLLGPFSIRLILRTPVNVLTGLNRLFSGFEKPIIKASKLFGVEYSSLIFELGNRKLVAGQEDLILEVAQKLKK